MQFEYKLVVCKKDKQIRVYDARQSGVPQLPRTNTMTRLHFNEIASPRTKLPRTSTCSVESEVVVVELLLLVGFRSSLLDPQT